jgi:hypothetical protein
LRVFGSRVRFVLGVLLACYIVTRIDAWRFMRGVPRAFGFTSVLLDLLSRLTSRGRGVSDYVWAVALVSRLALGCVVTLSRMPRACEMHE